MTAATSSWYDRVMLEEGSPAMEPLELSPWLEMYLYVAKMIEPHEEVVDLGCGTGRFIKLLEQRDHYAQITGVDFAPAVLDQAQRYCASGPVHPELPPVMWMQADLEGPWLPSPERAGNTVYVCTEVLEHLENDVAMVRAVPPGHRFIFSVPNYESESHLRVFRFVGDAWQRYGADLIFRSWRVLGEPRHSVHVYEAIRRRDAWGGGAG